MSFDLTKTILQDETLGGVKKLILAIIATHINDESGRGFPGVPRIAKMAGINDRNTRKHIAELCELGYLEITHRTGKSNLYAIPLSPEAPLSVETAPPVVSDTPPLSQATPKQIREQRRKKLPKVGKGFIEQHTDDSWREGL